MAGEEFEVWGVVRDNLTSSPATGPESDTPIDPFYELDCPMYVDFTQPDPLREEDLQAWFEEYVDREAGKPRSYPLFRDPAMDIALCQMEVERLLKESHAQGLRRLQTDPSQSRTPPRQRPTSGGSSSPSESPPGSCSPDSVLRPNSYRRVPKPGVVTSLSRSLDFGKASGKTKRHGVNSQIARSVELKKAPGMEAGVWEPSESRAASETADVSQAPLRAADTSKKPSPGMRLRPAGASVDLLKRPLESKPSSIRNPPSQIPLSEARRASEPRSPPTCKRYMLPTVTSIRKQDSHKLLRPPADGPRGSSPVQKPTWQPPSPVVRRTSPRHPTTGQSTGRRGAPSKSPGEVAELRRACYLQKLGEERKAKYRAELNCRGPVGVLWGQQQPGGLSPVPGGKTQGRFDAQQQAPLVLAL